MAVEIRDGLSGPSDLQEGFDEIARLESLEIEGIHVDSLAKKVDPTQTKVLAEKISQIHERLVFSSQRIIARRRSRRVVQTLMTRKHH